MTLRGARERAVASVQWEVRRLPIRAPLHDLLTPGRKIKPSSDKSPSKGPMMIAIVNFVRTSQAAICTNTDGLTSLGEAGVADREMEDMIAFNSLTDTVYSPTTTVLDSGLSVSNLVRTVNPLTGAANLVHVADPQLNDGLWESELRLLPNITTNFMYRQGNCLDRSRW
jgi:hypothetical protein